ELPSLRIPPGRFNCESLPLRQQAATESLRSQVPPQPNCRLRQWLCGRSTLFHPSVLRRVPGERSCLRIPLMPHAVRSRHHCSGLHQLHHQELRHLRRGVQGRQRDRDGRAGDLLPGLR
ncbi:unnamed protein product, partial [Symbiodinium sp. CCMP2456]